MKTDNHGSIVQSRKSRKNRAVSAQKAEEALRKSEVKYRLLFESSRDALMIDCAADMEVHPSESGSAAIVWGSERS